MNLVFVKLSYRKLAKFLKEFLSVSIQTFDWESPKYFTSKYQDFSNIKVDKECDKSTKFRQHYLVNKWSILLTNCVIHQNVQNFLFSHQIRV